jgi:uroporphyrinogen-III synthase
MSGDLDGVRVLVTRPADPESDFIASLERRGAIVASLPLIEIGPPPDERALRAAVSSAEQFDWVAFASAAGVEGFVRRRERPLPAPRPQLAAVGPATARAIEASLGRSPDLVPERYSGEALADALNARTSATEHILIVQAEDARPALAARLRSAGRKVTTVAAYSTVEIRPRDLDEQLRANDVIVLTSPSAARALVHALGATRAAAMLRGKLVACIGPVTLFEARQLGLHVEVVPASSTLEALVEALCTYYSRRPPAR